MSSLAQMVPEAFQQRLKDLGWYLGDVDGKIGPMTENALIDFKKYIGFAPRNLVTGTTMARLYAADAPKKPVLVKTPLIPKTDPKHIVEAKRLIGLREVPGPANNKDIMAMASSLDISYAGDDIPWCGLFIAHCLLAAGFSRSDFPKNVLGARNWKDYGEVVEEPVLGSIGAFWRTHPTRSWNGHVFFPTGIAPNSYQGIGGNQSDSVSVTHMPKDRLIAFVVPKGFKGQPLPKVAAGSLSVKED